VNPRWGTFALSLPRPSSAAQRPDLLNHGEQKAVVSPNRSIPFNASSAPISCHCSSRKRFACRPGCIQIGAGVSSSLPPVIRGSTDPKSCPMSSRSTPKSFTPKQGQYLAFIYAYTRVLGRPPAEADMQRHFGVSAPSVHQMVLTLERAGLVRRQPGVARSIEVLLAP
jgi:hypothetical protein